VRRALSLLQPASRSSRDGGAWAADIARVLGHLLAHSDPQIRASALAAASRTRSLCAELRAALHDHEPAVRAAAIVGLHTDAPDADVDAALAALLDGNAIARTALARAIGAAPHARWKPVLDQLIRREEPTVTREVLRVWVDAPELVDVERLLQLLEDPHVRGDVRRVFAVAGHLDRLIAALDDARTPLAVRRHLPRTISRFGTPAAVTALVDRLLREPDGTTEFKILRALGRMRVDKPLLSLEEAPVIEYAKRSIRDAERYAALESGLAGADEQLDVSLILLSELLAEKRRHAIERVFRALGILYPRADLRSVHDAITSDDDDRASAAREILEDLLPAAIRLPLVAMLAHETSTEYETYEDTIAALLADHSESLRCIAAHHVAERNLVALRPHLTRLRPTELLVTHAFDQAIARLDA
jgi:hypothetical protein